MVKLLTLHPALLSPAVTDEESTPPLRKAPTGTSANAISWHAPCSVSSIRSGQPRSSDSGWNRISQYETGDSIAGAPSDPTLTVMQCPGGSLRQPSQIDFGSGTYPRTR